MSKAKSQFKVRSVGKRGTTAHEVYRRFPIERELADRLCSALNKALEPYEAEASKEEEAA